VARDLADEELTRERVVITTKVVKSYQHDQADRGDSGTIEPESGQRELRSLWDCGLRRRQGRQQVSQDRSIGTLDSTAFIELTPPMHSWPRRGSDSRVTTPQPLPVRNRFRSSKYHGRAVCLDISAIEPVGATPSSIADGCRGETCRSASWWERIRSARVARAGASAGATDASAVQWRCQSLRGAALPLRPRRAVRAARARARRRQHHHRRTNPTWSHSVTITARQIRDDQGNHCHGSTSRSMDGGSVRSRQKLLMSPASRRR